MGLPYYAMDHFSKQVATSPFEEEYRQYCLPVLHPHVIKCTEVPFDQGSDHTIHEPLAKFTPLNISKLNAEGQLVPIHNPNHEIQEVAIDYDLGEQSQVKCRTNDEGQGTMMIKMSTRNHFTNTTIIAASNDRGHGYASLFYHLMYGVDPDWPKNPAVGYKFVAKCEIASIKFRTDNLHSSWRKVDFTLKGGVLRANVTEELCPNARADLGFSGFGDLYFDLEGAGEILASTDGYSKVFNRNQPAGNGTSIYENMVSIDVDMSTSWVVQISDTAILVSPGRRRESDVRSHADRLVSEQLQVLNAEPKRDQPAYYNAIVSPPVRDSYQLDAYYLHRSDPLPAHHFERLDPRRKMGPSNVPIRLWCRELESASTRGLDGLFPCCIQGATL